MILIKKLTHGYYRGTEKYALYNDFSVNFEIGMTGLIGPSGCGKSTLLSLIMNLNKPWQGDIKLNLSVKNNNFGYISQENELIEQLTVFENVLWKALLYFDENQAISNSYDILKRCGINDFDAKSNDLSGGQKQRVALARALVSDPDIIIGDEVTAHLDNESASMIIDLLVEVSKNKIVIMATHDIQLINRCDRLIDLGNKKENIGLLMGTS